MRYSRDVAIYAGADLVALGMGFLLSPLMTRLLDPEKYGVFPLLAALAGVIAPFQYGAMEYAFPMLLAKPTADREADRRRILGTATMVATACLTTIGALLVLFVALTPWVATFVKTDTSIATMYAISLVPSGLTYWYMSMLRYLHRAASYGALSILQRIGSSLIAIPLMLVVSADLRLYVLAVCGILAPGAAVAVGIWRLREAGLRPYNLASFSAPVAKRMFGIGIVIVPATLLYSLCSIVDRLLVGAYRGKDEVAILSLATAVASVIVGVRTWFQLVWDPHLVEWIAVEPESWYLPRLQKALNVLVVVFMPMAALSAIWSETVIAIVYPPSFAPAALLIPYMALAVSISTLSLLAVATIVVAQTPRYHIWIYGAGLAVNTGIGFWLVPRWGPLGAVVGALIAEGVILSLWIFLGQGLLRNLPLDWRGAIAVLFATAGFVAWYRPGNLLPTAVLAEQLFLSLFIALAAGVAGLRLGVIDLLRSARRPEKS